jgi:hypothetical protein
MDKTHLCDCIVLVAIALAALGSELGFHRKRGRTVSRHRRLGDLMGSRVQKGICGKPMRGGRMLRNGHGAGGSQCVGWLLLLLLLLLLLMLLLLSVLELLLMLLVLELLLVELLLMLGLWWLLLVVMLVLGLLKCYMWRMLHSESVGGGS